MKIGDFWFYSLMIFCASRTADALNVFVGLWLVPRYVEPAELGAVMPITSFANVIALPATIFATTFMKEVDTLANRGEYGKMKSLMRGVFVGVGVLLVLSIIIARLTTPLFLNHIHIAEGSLGLIIIASSFLTSVAPIYQNALQALKKFRAMSVLTFVGAPIRLIVMLVTMPFRPLSGYFVGQAATPAFNIFASVFCLRKELQVTAVPYWTKSIIKHFTSLFLLVACYQGIFALSSLVEQTVLRQQLPEIDTAAYYMVSRFSDIANYISVALLVTLFPFASELAAKGKPTRAFVLKASLVSVVFGVFLSTVFLFFGATLLRYLPHGELYSQYAWAIPWMIWIMVLLNIQGYHTNTEIAASRWGFLKWWIPVNLFFSGALLFVANHHLFDAALPEIVRSCVDKVSITSLKSILWWFTAFAVIRVVICFIELFRQPRYASQQ